MNIQTLPSKSRLLLSTGIAVAVALVIILVAVLPAEYGIDPTGIGKPLGLTSMGQTKQRGTSGGQVMRAHLTKFHSGRVEIRIQGREELEYKATLPQGEPMLYSWSVQGGAVYAEFHGEPTEGDWPKDFYQSYLISERVTDAHGSFIAPFTGKHGWYWRNLGDEPVSIVLEVSGYYSALGRVGNAAAL